MLNIPEVTEDSIDYAIDRLIGFIVVNKERKKPDQVQSLNRYCESVGISEEIGEYIFDKAEELFEVPGSIFVGVLLGLAVSEYHRDNKCE